MARKRTKRRRSREGRRSARNRVMLICLGLLTVVGCVMMLRRPGHGTMTVTKNEPTTRRGGAIASAWSQGCFGDPQESRAGTAAFGDGRGGTGLLKNIASVYLVPKEMLRGGQCGGRKAVAFAITLTKDGPFMDGAVVLGASIDKACADSEFLCDLVAFLHENVGGRTEDMLRHLGFRIMRPGLPLELKEIEDKFTRGRIEKGGCCGPAELMKFFSYSLTEYHRVVHLDTDVLVLQPLDPILDAKESLLHTTDVNMATSQSPVMPVQGGFLVVRPDMAVFHDIINVVKHTPFSMKGWGGTKIGMFWGGINVQGLLPYYYEHVASQNNTYRAVDRCVYNNMVDRPDCRVIPLAEVRSAHFTNCQKPWTCLYAPKMHDLCIKLFDQWFEIRKEQRTARIECRQKTRSHLMKSPPTRAFGSLTRAFTEIVGLPVKDTLEKIEKKREGGRDFIPEYLMGSRTAKQATFTRHFNSKTMSRADFQRGRFWKSLGKISKCKVGLVPAESITSAEEAKRLPGYRPAVKGEAQSIKRERRKPKFLGEAIAQKQRVV